MRFGAAVPEAVWRGAQCPIEHSLVHAAQLLGQPAANAVRRCLADDRVPVRGVLPSKEGLAGGPCILDVAEPQRKAQLVFQRFELRIGVRAVIQYTGPALALGDVQVHQPGYQRFGAHAVAAVGVQRAACSASLPGSMSWPATELAMGCWARSTSSRSAINQPSTQATEDVQNQPEVHTRPLGRLLELGWHPTTRPGWEPGPAARAWCGRGGRVDCAAHGWRCWRHWRPARGTWCAPRPGRRPRRAAVHAATQAPCRQSARC